MTVYVDNVYIKARVGRINARWCHLMADSDTELVEFAVGIGMKAAWIQDPDARYGAHFDVTESVRAKAVAAGAVEVDWRDLPELMNKLAAKRGKRVRESLNRRRRVR